MLSSQQLANVPVNNILINPFAEFDQPNEGASVALTSGTDAYSVDGFRAGYNSTATSVTVQQVSDGPGTLPKSIRLTVGTAAGSIAIGNYAYTYQRIEASNLSNLNLGTITAVGLWLSFWAKFNIGNYNFCATLQNFAQTRSYPLNFNYNTANVWQYFSAYIPGDIAGAWITSGTAGGAILAIVAAGGSTFQGAANIWNAGNYLATSAITNTLLTTTGATFEVTGIDFRISPAPSFRRPFQQELALCQRYYEKSYDLGTAVGTGTFTGCFSSRSVTAAAYLDTIYWKVVKRVDPTVMTYSANTGASAVVYDNSVNANPTSVIAFIGIGSAQIASPGGSISAGDQIDFQYTADSRL
jgi:hypothetical protein